MEELETDILKETHKTVKIKRIIEDALYHEELEYCMSAVNHLGTLQTANKESVTYHHAADDYTSDMRMRRILVSCIEYGTLSHLKYEADKLKRLINLAYKPKDGERYLSTNRSRMIPRYKYALSIFKRLITKIEKECQTKQ